MRIAIANTQVPFCTGGAEAHAEGLRRAILAHGHEAELLNIPFRWYPPEKILDHLMACRLIDVTEANGQSVDLLIGLRFPAYHLKHPSKVLWILHQYRSAFDLWEQPGNDLATSPAGRAMRGTIANTERALLGEARAIFANSHNVARRLKGFSGFSSEVLYHPPPLADRLECRGEEPYFFFPSRISEHKRQLLVAEALQLTRQPVRVVLAGAVEDPSIGAQLKRLASKLGDRLVLAGRIDESTLIEHYGKCRAVIYPPLDEDYGYVTLEAQLAHKPVITCTDSGGVLEFVSGGNEGWVAAPEAETLAAALDEAWEDGKACRERGEAGFQRYGAAEISWEQVVNSLTA